MPKRETAEDVLTRNTWLMYYVWKKGGVNANISELSKELGYSTDGALNTRINYLKSEGYIKEKWTKKGNMFKLTNKGIQKILFLVMPKWALTGIFIISLANIQYAIGEIWLNLPIEPLYLLFLGLISLVLVLLLYWMQIKGERQFVQIGKHLQEDQIPSAILKPHKKKYSDVRTL
ncbi:MAG: hypothetical protein QXR45_12265 [Candidatus Bathyarchaeia archaeon]